MAFTLGTTSATGAQFSLSFGDAPKKVVAGEPKGFPSRGMMIAGGLAVAAIALIFLMK